MNRRRLFGLIPAVLAGAVLPASAEILRPEKKGPILLERTCDGGWESQGQYDAASREVGCQLFRGCRTVFQWYWWLSGYPTCPNCGYCYLCTLEDVKSGRYTPKE